MNKLKMLGILLVAIGGALIIYSHFDKKRNEQIVYNVFNSEYNIEDEDNVFVYKNIEEILEIFDSKTGIIFFCTPTSKWCKKYAYYLNIAIKENGYLGKVYYLDISKERSLNSMKYQKLLNYLDNYLYKDDQNISKINMPDLTFIKDGVIIEHNNDTSIIPSDVNEDDYWNTFQINEFKNKINNYIEEIK